MLNSTLSRGRRMARKHPEVLALGHGSLIIVGSATLTDQLRRVSRPTTPCSLARYPAFLSTPTHAPPRPCPPPPHTGPCHSHSHPLIPTHSTHPPSLFHQSGHPFVEALEDDGPARPCTASPPSLSAPSTHHRAALSRNLAAPMCTLLQNVARARAFSLPAHLMLMAATRGECSTLLIISCPLCVSPLPRRRPPWPLPTPPPPLLSFPRVRCGPPALRVEALCRTCPLRSACVSSVVLVPSAPLRDRGLVCGKHDASPA